MELLLKSLRLEFAADFDQNAFVFGPIKRRAKGGKINLLRRCGNRVHFDLRPLPVVPGVVAHLGGVEIAAGQTIDVVKDVENEFGRYAEGVVVSRFEHAGVLDSIGAEQQIIIRPHRPGKLGEEANESGWRKIADGATEEDKQCRDILGDAGKAVFVECMQAVEAQLGKISGGEVSCRNQAR